jgi:Aspartyl protease
MRKQFWISGLICVAISVASACGQERPNGNKPLAEISYRPVGKLIYVPVEVNGSGPLWFIFDTGAPNSIIDTAAARSLHLQSISSGIIHGTGKGDVSAEDAGEVQFALGGLTIRVPHAKIVDLSKVPVPVKSDGLLGAEFLEQYVVRIDPAAHTIAFYDPDAFSYQGQGKSLPLELANSRLYVHIGLAANPGEMVERRLRVDTGSEDSIDDDTVRNSPVTQKTSLGNGLGMSYEDVSGIYDTVMIGPFAFHHVWGPAGAVPIVGMEILRRFTLTFDAKRGLLYLEPNSSFNEPVPAPS